MEEHPQIKNYFTVQEEFRKDASLEAQPHLQWAMKSDEMAVDLGQSILKTGNLLHGGALLAIPTVLGLFNSAHGQAAYGSILFVASHFIAGIFSNWLSAMFGFLALASRSDREYYSYSIALGIIRKKYYNASTGHPDYEKSLLEHMGKLKPRKDKLHKNFVRRRLASICFSFASVALFVLGVMQGACLVKQTPQPNTQNENIKVEAPQPTK